MFRHRVLWEPVPFKQVAVLAPSQPVNSLPYCVPWAGWPRLSWGFSYLCLLLLLKEHRIAHTSRFTCILGLYAQILTFAQQALFYLPIMPSS